MRKRFNITGSCIPSRHYMVDIKEKLDKIEQLIEDEEYFTINRSRQYGKTTTLDMLENRLCNKYLVFNISFESIADIYYESEEAFSDIFLRKIIECMEIQELDDKLVDFWKNIGAVPSFYDLATKVDGFCRISKKEIVLMIDEVDKSSDNKMFLSFLGMLRERYLKRNKYRTFKSVILAGVYDVKNLKLKLRPEEESKYNSPWNIAAKFKIDMSFSEDEIQSMLDSYEEDKHIGFDTKKVAEIIHNYTNGYPFLVSAICKCVDEELCDDYGFKDLKSAWSKEGVLYAIKVVEETRNLLFDDINKQLNQYSELNNLVKDILLKGVQNEYVIGDEIIEIGTMFGILGNIDGKLGISNRIFEVYLYNKFISENNRIENRSVLAKSARNYREDYIIGNELNMELILQNFAKHYTQYYKDELNSKDKKFIEDNGRFLFLTFIKPIINGDGNFYVEARTRNGRRTDVIIDYHAKQYIVELKIWHGDEYNKRGEKQTFDYLSYYEVDKGYLVSFNFNKNKEYKYEEIEYKGKTIVEVVI